MSVYLDHAATTFCSPSAAEVMQRMLTVDYGNPSAMHKKGMEAENAIKDAAKILADTIRCTPEELIFTSGGTESNNLALLGAAHAYRRRGMHIVTTAFEHASVQNPIKILEEEGFRVTRLGVDATGHVDPEELAQAVGSDTILVSIMHVNNEIGAMQDLAVLGERIKKANPDTLFHVDAIQSYGKVKIPVGKCRIDLLSVSGHKIHGPKGTGFLYCKKNTRLTPLLYGGGQQRDLRSGTENVPGICALSAAAKECYAALEERVGILRARKEELLEALRRLDAAQGGIFINGPQTSAEDAPHIVNAAFTGVRSEVLLHALEEKGIYVSAGGACSTHKRAPSATLTAIGLAGDRLESSLRFSLDTSTTAEDIAATEAALGELVPALRRFQRK